MDIFEKHQLIIARKILKLTDIAVESIGGMTKDEAREIIKKEEEKNGSHAK